MARPLCDHCLALFEDNPDEGPDEALKCADAYLFTCDECCRRPCLCGPAA